MEWVEKFFFDLICSTKLQNSNNFGLFFLDNDFRFTIHKHHAFNGNKWFYFRRLEVFYAKICLTAIFIRHIEGYWSHWCVCTIEVSSPAGEKETLFTLHIIALHKLTSDFQKCFYVDNEWEHRKKIVQNH